MPVIAAIATLAFLLSPNLLFVSFIRFFRYLHNTQVRDPHYQTYLLFLEVSEHGRGDLRVSRIDITGKPVMKALRTFPVDPRLW